MIEALPGIQAFSLCVLYLSEPGKESRTISYFRHLPKEGSKL